MLSKIFRLKTNEIKSLSSGTSVFGTLVLLRFVDGNKPKFSVSVSKKLFKEAVKRNKIRRRVYSAIRPLLKDIKKPLFIMIIPKKECLDIDLTQITLDLERIFKKIKLV